MKYKNLRLRIVLPSILIVIIVAMVVAFFTGGLELGAITKDDIEWSEEGFITPELQLLEDGSSKWVFYKTNEKGEQEAVDLNKNRLVSEQGNYRMYFDESTTIITIKEILRDADGNETGEKELYSTAKANGSSNAEKSSITLYYYDANGTLNPAFNSFDKSVNYDNTLKGVKEKHYSIRYNETDGSIDLLYQIGNFANLLETFPKYYNRADFEDTFMGNIIIQYTSRSYNSIQVETAEGLVNAKEIAVDSKNGGLAVCFDNECALYILKNGLGTLKYEYSDASYKPAYGSTEEEIADTTFDSVPEDEAKILEKSGGVWYVYNIVDENGKLKFVLGENCNNGSSPVKLNPFLNSAIFVDSIFSQGYYPIKYDSTNEAGEKVIKDLSYKDRSQVEDAYLQFNANTSLPSQELYQYLVVGGYSYLSTSQEIYSYLQDEDKPGQLKVLNSVVLTQGSENVYYDYNGDGTITSDEGYLLGGYQAKDPQGNYLYIDENNYVFYFDANGNRMLNDEEGNPQPVDSTSAYKPFQTGLTSEMTQTQNDRYNVGAEASSVAFQVALRYKLTENGMEVTIINDSIIEGLGKDADSAVTPAQFKHDCKIAKIEVNKFLTTNNDSSSVGSIVIPDGSGAVISFNSAKVKQYVDMYKEKFIYGADMAINRDEAGNKVQDILLPMYAFIEDGDNGAKSKGVSITAIVEKGAAQTSITADFMRSSELSGMNPYNYAYFTSYFRSSESVSITSSSSYTKISEALYDSDIKYVYRILTNKDLGKGYDENGNYNPINYVDIAQDYRAYLVDLYDLSEKDETKVATPTITFVGAYEKKTIKLGVVYDKEYALTTFEEAGKIVDELTNKGISSMNVTYTLWTDDEKYNKISDEFKVSSVLGGKNDLEDLNNKLTNYKYNFFLDYTFTTGFGYDYSFGALKFNSKSISGAQSNALSYVLSTGLADAQGKVGGRLSPVFYNSLVTKFMKNYGKLNINGINVTDLGNRNSSDYSKDRIIYSADGSLYQVEALKTLSESGKKVMLESPFDYAFKYLDIATNVPVETTLYPIVDYSIPFYQLVVSGLFDYSAPTINSGNDYSVDWNLLKAIETGSNIAFEVSSSDTINLLDTDYTSYYNSYFSNWEDKILSMNEKLQKTGIYESKLVNHEFITDTLVKVTYNNGLEILINYSKDNYYGDGLAIRSYDFAILKQGKEA